MNARAFRALELARFARAGVVRAPELSKACVRIATRSANAALAELAGDDEKGLRAASLRRKLEFIEARYRSDARRERRQRLARLLLSSWVPRAIALVALLAVAVYGLHGRGKENLLAGVPSTLSSEWQRCQPSRGLCGGVKTEILFHTLEQSSPFVVYDLGRPHTVRELRVENRSDALQQRAVPLVAEVSLDNQTFREVARQAYWFQSWRAEFAPVSARYFRLRVPRVSTLHLERVELR